MDVNCFHHVIQYGGCQFVHVKILMHLADEPFNVLCLFFLSVNFLIQLQQLFPQFFLFLFVIVREHLKSAVRKFTICVIFRELLSRVNYHKKYLKILQNKHGKIQVLLRYISRGVLSF